MPERTRHPASSTTPRLNKGGQGGVFLALAFLATANTFGAAISTTATSPATASAPGESRIVHFQRGVRIDWTHRQVEVDATVILREGLIELFACSPQIREHEAIVRIEARPLHVFHALGLIGITPGHPVLYDDEADRRSPAVGDPVDISIRYSDRGLIRVVPIEKWMEQSDGRPVDPLPWVFAGSVELEDDSIAADYEGTVVAVVDFGSSLIALPELHTDRNEDLWLQPATAAIPPVGTRCTLIFRRGLMEVRLDATGRLRMGGRRATLAEAARRIQDLSRREDPPRLRVVVDPNCPETEARVLRRLLEGFEQSLEVADRANRPVSTQHSHDAEALIGWLTWRFMPPPATSANGQENSFDR